MRQRGFGLVQVVVAIGLLSIVSLGLATAFAQFGKMQAFASAKLASLNLAQDIRTQLQLSDACDDSLKVTGAIAASKPTTVQVSIGGDQIHEGMKLPTYSNIEVTLLRLDNVKLVTNLPPPSGGHIYSANLMLGTQTSEGQSFNTMNAIHLFVTTSATGAFTKCLSSETSTICTDMGGVYNPETKPNCKLPTPTPAPPSPSLSGARICGTTTNDHLYGVTGSSNCCNTTENSTCSIASSETQACGHDGNRSCTTTKYICLCTPKN